MKAALIALGDEKDDKAEENSEMVDVSQWYEAHHFSANI
jgi:hypothetical protein